MNATMEKLSSNKVKVSFVVDAERFEKAIEGAYRKNASRINVQGFRRGKAPRKVIEMMYGANVFYEDAVDAIFPQVYQEAIEQYKLAPVDRPENFTVDEIGAGKDLQFSIEVFVEPDVVLGQYLGVTAHKHVTEVTEDDVNAEIERARERDSRYVDVEDRPVQLDDQVTLSYEGVCEGERFEGGSAEDHRLIIGSGTFIPGFEEQLVGAQIGQALDVNVTFPEDYHAEALRGKPAVFHCVVKSIQEKEVPALDDEFAKDVSEFQTFVEYKDATRERLVKQAAERDAQAFENAVLEVVVENAQMDIPAAMIEEQIDNRLSELESNMRRQGIDMKLYYEITGQSEAAIRDQMRDEAERNVRARLTIEAICKAEQVEATEEDLLAEMAKFADQQGEKSAEEMLRELPESSREYVAHTARMRKTIERIKSAAVPDEHCDHDHDHDHDHEDHAGEQAE